MLISRDKQGIQYSLKIKKVVGAYPTTQHGIQHFSVQV